MIIDFAYFEGLVQAWCKGPNISLGYIQLGQSSTAHQTTVELEPPLYGVPFVSKSFF